MQFHGYMSATAAHSERGNWSTLHIEKMHTAQLSAASHTDITSSRWQKKRKLSTVTVYVHPLIYPQLSPQAFPRVVAFSPSSTVVRRAIYTFTIMLCKTFRKTSRTWTGSSHLALQCLRWCMRTCWDLALSNSFSLQLQLELLLDLHML